MSTDLRSEKFATDHGRAVIFPPAWLGMVGGGQLGRMFVHAAQRLGYHVIVLTPEPNAPAAQAADACIQGDYNDLDAVKELAEWSAAVTVEFENISAAALRWLSRRLAVRPGWRAIWISQNRIREKSFLKENDFPLPRWMPIVDLEGLRSAVKALPVPWVLKTAAAGYDGKGQVKIDHRDEAEAAWRGLGSPRCVAESWVDFAAELSVVVARGFDGASVSYSVSENDHCRHILDTSVVPARIGPLVTKEAKRLALAVAEALQIVGVLTVEFFVLETGNLMINELAPRPHNSGHLTIEGAVTSQFEQQVRALVGLPLGSTERTRSAAMANLLGDLWSVGEPPWPAMLAFDPGVKLHLYGKENPTPGRKMGHLTVVDANAENALIRVTAARALLEEKARMIQNPSISSTCNHE